MNKTDASAAMAGDATEKLRALSALSSRERKVLKIVTAAAARGEPCPTNARLAASVGATSMSVGAGCIRALEAHGLVAMRRSSRSRIVTILATGAKTAGPRSPIRVYRPRGETPALPPPTPPALDMRNLAAVDADLIDQIEIEAIRTGIRLADFYERIVWLGWHCHLEAAGRPAAPHPAHPAPDRRGEEVASSPRRFTECTDEGSPA